jgi:hypothetical protein
MISKYNLLIIAKGNNMFFKQNSRILSKDLIDWKESLNTIFQNNIPEHYEWCSLNDISYTLNLIAKLHRI